MSVLSRNSRLVLETIAKVDADAPDGVTSNMVGKVLREQRTPLPDWQIRGEFSLLEEAGYLSFTPTTSKWRLASKNGD